VKILNASPGPAGLLIFDEPTKVLASRTKLRRFSRIPALKVEGLYNASFHQPQTAGITRFRRSAYRDARRVGGGIERTKRT